jgi:hypothetical protein
MTAQHSSIMTRVQRGCLAVAVVLLAWSVYQRFGVDTVSPDTTGSMLLSLAAILGCAAPFARQGTLQYVLIGLAIAILLASFLARS